MKRYALLSAAALAFGAFAPLAQAYQANGTAGSPRSTNNRVDTESSTPPPVNSDYRKAAEGQLPTVPGTSTVAPTAPGALTGALAPRAGQGAVDPATPLVPGRAGDGQGDPAAGLQPGARNLLIERVGERGRPEMAGMGALPAGLDVAMLIEHAVGMGMEASALQAIGEMAPDDAACRSLIDHARQQMVQAKAMLAMAAEDGRGIPADSPARRFYGAANNYLTTLGQLTAPGAPSTPMDKAQVALINHSVKHVLDADHIRQFGRAFPGSQATNQMIDHSKAMRAAGIEAVTRLAGAGAAGGTVDPAAPATATLLAQRGRELLDATDQLAALTAGPNRMIGVPMMANPTANLPADPNPARLRDTRAEIVGGTSATGSPTTGTATGPEAAANVKNSRELPNGQLVVPTPSGAPGTGTSNYGEGNNNTPPTNSSAGSRPR